MAQRIAVLRRRLFDLVSAVSLVLCLAVVTLRIRGGMSGISGWARPGGNLYLVQSQSDLIVFGKSGPWPCGECRWNSDAFPVESEPDDGPGETPWHYHFLGLATLSSEGLVAVDPDGRVPWTLGGRGGTATAQPSVPVRAWTVAVPSWLLLAVLAPLPAVWIGTLIGRFRAYRRRRLSDCTHCYTCGYNLTGNTSGVCPECGSPVTPAAAARGTA